MYQADTRRRILSYERQYRTSADRMAELRLQEDLHILKDAQVVGMTTTGRKVGGFTCSSQVHRGVQFPSNEEKYSESVEATLILGALGDVLLLVASELKTQNNNQQA